MKGNINKHVSFHPDTIFNSPSKRFKKLSSKSSKSQKLLKSQNLENFSNNNKIYSWIKTKPFDKIEINISYNLSYFNKFIMSFDNISLTKKIEFVNY